MVGTIPIPPDYLGKEEVIASLVADVEAMIRRDGKVIALNQLQVMTKGAGFRASLSLQFWSQIVDMFRVIYGDLDFKETNWWVLCLMMSQKHLRSGMLQA